MQQQSYRLALRVSLIYGLAGSVWIFSSDWLVAVLVPRADQITHFQTYKGWAFIGVTTVLLFAVLRLALGRWERETQERQRAEALTDAQNRVLELLTRGVPLQESLTALLHFLEAQVPDLRCSIVLLDADGVHIRHGAAPNLPEEFNRAVDGLVIGEGAGSCGTAAFRREPVIVADTATDPLWHEYRAVAAAHGLRACWSTPIFDADRRVLGTFALYSRLPGHPNAQHLRLIGHATHVAALAISKQREEEARRESEERFRALVTFSPDAVYSHIDGRITFVNPAMCRLLGATEPTQLLGKSVFAIVHPDYHALVRERWQVVFAGKPAPIVEEKFVRLNGVPVEVEVSAVRLEFQGRQEVQVIAREITQRKQVEAALREGELRQRELVERLTVAQAVGKVGSWETDLTTMAVTWSEQAHRIFETTPVTFQPTHLAFIAFVHPEDRALVDQAFRDSLGQTDLAAIEHRIVLSGGRIKIVEERWRVFRDEQGRPVRAVGTVQDITERKQAEKKLEQSRGQLRALIARLQRAQEEERTRVAREIHDELGQLLTGLKMDVRWLEKKLSTPGLPPALNPLLDRAVAASELADTAIATVQKIAAELRPGALDKLGLAAALTQKARRFQERSGIHCAVTVSEPDIQLPPEVATELFYIAQEALTNVARHAQAKTVEIRLTTERDATVLEVCDDGVGITEADQNAVGSLGLLGMKERVAHCAGSIAIERGMPGGTQITVRIPRGGTVRQEGDIP
jgi:PAS domain S-box-containing protein